MIQHELIPFFSLQFIASHHFSVYTVGDAGAIRCSFTGATRTEWLYNGEVVTSLAGDELLLNIAVNDSIHGGVYSCRGYSNVSVIPDLNVAMIIQGKLCSYLIV